MVTISKITWISPSAQEAEVTLEAEAATCVAFCQPCQHALGDQITEPLHAFSLRSVKLAEAARPILEKLTKSGLEQRGIGRVVDLTAGEIDVGGLRVVFDDNLPGGLTVGDTIEFECGRIDLW